MKLVRVSLIFLWLLCFNSRALTLGESDNQIARRCWHGDAISCIKQAEIFFRGDEVTKVNRLASRQYYEYACSLNDASGCSKAGYLYSIAYDKNFDKAMEFSLKGCGKQDAPGCLGVGFLLEHGLGTQKDDRKALSFYDKACALHDKQGCLFARKLKADALNTQGR